MSIVEGGTDEAFHKCTENNHYLMPGSQIGEGVVIKRYNFVNKFGRTVWAKLVRNEFKAKHQKCMGPTVITAKATIERTIAEEYVTASLVEKEYAKIALDGWSSKCIPRLLGTVWHCLISEEAKNFIKKHRNPTVDFKLLNRYCNARVKELKPEVF